MSKSLLEVLNHMKYKISLCISALCFLLHSSFPWHPAPPARRPWHPALPLKSSVSTFWRESDSTRDQNLKLGVKGLVLDYIHGQVPEDTDKEQLKQWIEGNKTSIETMAQDWLADQGSLLSSKSWN